MNRRTVFNDVYDALMSLQDHIVARPTPDGAASRIKSASLSEIDRRIKLARKELASLHQERIKLERNAVARRNPSLTSMPSNILAIIFRFCAEDQSSFCAVMLVCRQWRARILQIPQLWCRLRVVCRQMVDPERAAGLGLWLARSEERPLDITIIAQDCDKAQYDLMRFSLAQIYLQQYRWQSFAMLAASEELAMAILGRCQGPVLFLESLEIHVVHRGAQPICYSTEGSGLTHFQPIFRCAPRLRCVNLTGIALPIGHGIDRKSPISQSNQVAMPWFQKLSSLSLTSSMTQSGPDWHYCKTERLLNALKLSPDLTRLVIDEAGWQEGYTRSLPAVSLPALRELELRHPEALLLLRHIRPRALRGLVLSFPQKPQSIEIFPLWSGALRSMLFNSPPPLQLLILENVHFLHINALTLVAQLPSLVAFAMYSASQTTINDIPLVTELLQLLASPLASPDPPHWPHLTMFDVGRVELPALAVLQFFVNRVFSRQSVASRIEHFECSFNCDDAAAFEKLAGMSRNHKVGPVQFSREKMRTFQLRR
ncbi:hypothetical protein BOTBODRAFT_62215 [Botryobasidium botryosum FD-172 SS1]|uniref:Uncharacterized protein n=1 Tax=Botryobasidium botryosum (strain FD-172 SS1) TaxID=930990 RepID=A0A067MW53_BOTB1|nr:hypothetical protein BOTBODRAFT_62215 [Botryobasidium botryosum FD-172 SS1]